MALFVKHLVDLAARVAPLVNRLVEPLIRLGIASPLPVGLGVVLLETTGRQSGRTRTVPLLAARAGQRVYVSTARPTSQWAANLNARPEASVWIGGRRRDATALVTRSGDWRLAELQLR